MDTWLNHRIIHDWRLLLEEFRPLDWLVVGATGIFLGFVIAWAFSRVSRKKLRQLEREIDVLQENRKIIASLEEEKAALEARPPEVVTEVVTEVVKETVLVEVPAKPKPQPIPKPKPEKTPVAALAAAKAQQPQPPKEPAPIPEPEPEPEPAKPTRKRRRKEKEHLGNLFEAGDRVVFVLDVSKTMERQPRDFFNRCKKRLEEGVSNLANLEQDELPRFQVIFFSGPTWFANQKVIRRNNKVMISDTNGSVTWHRTGRNEYQYKPGIARLPVGEWLQATEKHIADIVKTIRRQKTSPGTTWHRPLTMAMNLNPAPGRIDFLTDGQTANAEEVSREIVAMIKEKGSDTVVNTFGVGEGASEPLRYIAEQTGGAYYDFSDPLIEHPELPGIASS